ncbi:hypothetical protein niasHT_023782 [Heterodera trifolii]|uniref:Carboxypeptidase n=1 Tax=Heterodera trifolii TaxID=157864 RepID=A0ABD2JNP7_9BILA
MAVIRLFLLFLPFLLFSPSAAFIDDPNLCLRLTSAAHDEIQELPGLSFRPNFKHYSGFLKTTSKNLFHYWFVTSENKPCQDPLLFWFNGGPGCSSLGGLLDELGPYLINADGKTLRKSPYAWNKNASIVYIESPAGVGFSHSVDGLPAPSSDDSTAAENYEAVKQFFNKFPLFRANPTFITGESYAGIYVPMLVAKIVDGQAEFPINLEGMAIGNGFVNAPLDTDTLARFAYAHGLVEESKWNQIAKQCCGGCLDTCDLGSLYGSCRSMVAEIVHFCWRGGLNVYDIYENCTPHPNNLDIMRRGIFNAKSMHSNDSVLWRTDDDFENANQPKEEKVNYLLRCLNGQPLVDYLNKDQVRKALHIPPTVPSWTQCSRWVAMHYRNQYADMSHFVWKALWANVRVLLFYGDTDMACNFLLGQRFSEMLGLKRLGTNPWHFGGQIAGIKTEYGSGLTYITVRGAGHMVPQKRGSEIDYAIGQFLTNRTI